MVYHTTVNTQGAISCMNMATLDLQKVTHPFATPPIPIIYEHKVR